MKAWLLYPDRDVDLDRELPAHAQALSQDLGVPDLVAAMADEDELLAHVAHAVLLAGAEDLPTIRYRQQVLADCMREPAFARELYALAVEALGAKRRTYYLARPGQSPSLLLHSALGALELLLDTLHALRRLADAHAATVRSPGLVGLCAMVAAELDDAYLDEVRAHVRQLRFAGGVLLSARLGPGNAGRDHVLRAPQRASGLRARIATLASRDGYVLQIPDRDEAGARSLDELRGRGLNEVANAAAQSVDHVLSFFAMLRAELAFYVGALNLHDRLAALGEPTCTPDPHPAQGGVLHARGLYDPGLSLRSGQRAVGNDLDADGRPLVTITGPNQGGKSTFLRAVGLAQLMTGAGLFACAEQYAASVSPRLFTHFKREEDPTMRAGKLDEELARMHEIAEQLVPTSMLLCNESFASTNEREGSQIAGEIVRALLDSGVRVLYVTHLYELAEHLHRDEQARGLFLRAQRTPDGRRTFRLREGAPLSTSHAADVYERVFGRVVGPRSLGVECGPAR